MGPIGKRRLSLDAWCSVHVMVGPPTDYPSPEASRLKPSIARLLAGRSAATKLEDSMASTSAPGSEQKRRRMTRTAQKEERQILSGLNNLFEEDEDQELKYIVDELNGDKRRHVPRIAAMLRKGILDKLDAKDLEADELAEKVTKFKQLKASEVVGMIKHFEPSASEADLKALPRNILLKRLCFSLHLKESADLPNNFPTLRCWGPLLDYTRLAYLALGRRLKAICDVQQIEADTVKGFFTIDMANGRIIANTVTNQDGGANCSFAFDLPGATDWVVDKAFSKDAVIKSESLGSTTKLASRLLKATGQAIPDEDGDWELTQPLPESVVGSRAATETGGQAAPAAALAPPPGDGRAGKGARKGAGEGA